MCSKARPKDCLVCLAGDAGDAPAPAPLDPQLVPFSRVRIKDDRDGGVGGSTTRVYVKTKMMLPCKLPAFFTLALGLPLIPAVHAHPVWHDFNSRNSIDSFITGSTVLLAGGVKFGVPYYLTTTPLPSGTKHYSLSVRCVRPV
jgi:hypothetical protein